MQNEKIDFIKKLIAENSKMTVEQLATELKLSADSIRKYLAKLKISGFIKRVYGAAIINNAVKDTGSNDTAKSFHEICNKNYSSLAKTVISILPPKGVILSDCSHICWHVAQAIVDSKLLNYLVVSNSLNVETILANNNQINQIGIGGSYNFQEQGFLGTSAILQLRSLHIDYAIIECEGIDLKTGDLTVANEKISDFKKSILMRANALVLVVNSANIVNASFYRWANLSEIKILVTDSVSMSEVIDQSFPSIKTIICNNKQ